MFLLKYYSLHLRASVNSFMDSIYQHKLVHVQNTLLNYYRITEVNPQSENDIDWSHIAENWHRYIVEILSCLLHVN